MNKHNERIAARDKAESDLAETIRINGEKALRDWAIQDGSALLRERIDGGYEWIGLAEQEFANAAVSLIASPEAEYDGYDCDTVADRTTPTMMLYYSRQQQG